MPRERLRGSQIKTKQQQAIRHNQLLVAEIDAKMGAFGMVPRELEGSIVSGHYFLYDIDSAQVLPEFLECFIASGLLTEEIQKDVQGALNYAAIRPYHVLEVWIPVPPNDPMNNEQAKFVQQLREAQTIRSAATRQLEAAVALEKALMRLVFDGFEPPESDGGEA